MSTPTHSRLTIEVNGAPRRLASFGVKKRTGDVYLRLPDPGPFGGFRMPNGEIQNPELVGHQIAEQRFTIHPSERSGQFINDIHQYIYFSGRTKPITTANYTKAIKSQYGFAPLYVCIAPSLADKRHIPNKYNDKNITLGRYDPDMFSFIYAVLVANQNRPFCIPEDYALRRMNLLQFTIGFCRIVTLSSYLFAPSSSSTRIFHYGTSPMNTSYNDPEFDVTAVGMTEKDSIDWFSELCWSSLPYIRRDLALENTSLSKFAIRLSSYTNFYKTGILNERDFEEQIYYLLAAGGFPGV